MLQAYRSDEAAVPRPAALVRDRAERKPRATKPAKS